MKIPQVSPGVEIEILPGPRDRFNGYEIAMKVSAKVNGRTFCAVQTMNTEMLDDPRYGERVLCILERDIGRAVVRGI
ncbi:hypothetical protein [Lysobacter sp. CA199]|uniref:hypothetical protein n=1 Tax=Lysobacter sp. CA199 TaxID=3455608 RepID=UPI003F8D063E